MRTQRDILKAAAFSVRHHQKVAWIAVERAECTIAACGRALPVSPSGFYAWQQPPESGHTIRDQQLGTLIRLPDETSRPTYESPRVLADLRARGIRVSRKRVARLMRAAGLRARVRKRLRSTTVSEHDQPIAGNVLARRFAAERPNQRWVGDTTAFLNGSSAKLYLPPLGTTLPLLRGLGVECP